MSLPTDIIQLFGTGSVPAIVAGTVLGVFEVGERFASQRAKDALSKWLLTFDVKKAGALPDGTQELFEKIFGERHFTLKCFIRSAAFSLSAMAFIMILGFLINPKDVLSYVLDDSMALVAGFASWLPWSIIIDYISLFKTRVILGIVARVKLHHLVVAVTILVVDFIGYIILYIVGVILVASAISVMGIRDNALPSEFSTLIQVLVVLAEVIIDTITEPQHVYLFNTFWAGFAPSIWLWLYVLALFVTRGLLRSERIVNWLRWALDVEKNPFRSIGAVAATLAFVGSVAIILVSAEVSRISAAS